MILEGGRYHGGCIELDAIVDGQSVACKWAPSAIHSLAEHLWEVVTPEMIWGAQACPKTRCPKKLIEHALFVGELETPMRDLAGVLAAEGHRKEARRCLLRVIFRKMLSTIHLVGRFLIAIRFETCLDRVRVV